MFANTQPSRKMLEKKPALKICAKEVVYGQFCYYAGFVNEKFPNKWNEGIIIKAPNKVYISQCRNWWGIILLVVISKIFNKILLEQIKNTLEKGLHK
jgi:hypothetical protein